MSESQITDSGSDIENDTHTIIPEDSTVPAFRTVGKRLNAEVSAARKSERKDLGLDSPKVTAAQLQKNRKHGRRAMSVVVLVQCKESHTCTIMDQRFLTAIVCITVVYVCGYRSESYVDGARE